MSQDLTLRYWRAVADLPAVRMRALAELDECFRRGSTPSGLSGSLEGRLVTTTLGYGLDAITMGLARVWMPWKGKTFEPDRKEGWNLFSPEFRWLMRVLWPSYDDVGSAGPGRLSAFRFTTWEGPGALHPDLTTFKIDYDHEGSPRFLIRPILDELMEIEPGLYLGQALLRWRGALRRVAWFSLSGRVP
ncbi:MAG TPA: hypothetical protein VGR41_02125 [Actinomycetota bacterium]|jgi:hypothetical protein|nr:hypothetical protein [Actinomycetota bacterium]